MTEVERLKFLELLDMAPDGLRIEFGVFRGDTLALMTGHLERTIGVDSFEGMPTPGPCDFTPDGESPYPKGRLRSNMDAVRSAAPRAHLVKGFIPQLFDWFDPAVIAFAHVDLDHYEPTRATLDWLFPRMKTGGVIVCDDWFPDRDYLAAKAINEFAEEVSGMKTCGRKAWWVL